MGVLRTGLVALVTLLSIAIPLRADVVRVVVEDRNVAWGGRAFGEVGSYELLRVRLFFLFDPGDPADAAVVDLALAPRNADGLVEAETVVWVLQPVEVQRRRGVAWVDLDPWGVGPAAPLFAAALGGGEVAAEGLEDGLLLDTGLTLILIDPEASGVPRVDAPGGGAVVARDSTGGEVIGWVRRRWEVSEAAEQLDLDAGEGWHHPVTMPEAPVHRLFEGPGSGAATDSVPSSEWAFLPQGDGRDARAIVRDGGFEAGRSYEIVYRARQPRVQGLALAVLRDVMAYARYDVRSEFPADRGIAFGSGPGGRLLRQFLYDGFNDAGGRTAFDALWMHGAGAGRGDINRRFALPNQTRDLVDLYPFTLEAQFDPVTGLDEGLLPPGESAGPRAIITHAGSDYRFRGASLTHTTVDGLSDRIPGDDHRAYHLAGVEAGPVETLDGAVDPRPLLRALAASAIRWIVDDTPMPESTVPSVGMGTLVRPSAVAFPSLPGVDSTIDHSLVYREDPGPRFATEGIADRITPDRGAAFPVLLPQVDGFGNELGGIRGVELRVPLATYRSGAIDFPLAPTPGSTEQDPRPDLQSLYGSEAGYLARARAAADALVREGFLLERDRGAVIDAARERWQRLTPPPR